MPFPRMSLRWDFLGGFGLDSTAIDDALEENFARSVRREWYEKDLQYSPLISGHLFKIRGERRWFPVLS